MVYIGMQRWLEGRGAHNNQIAEELVCVFYGGLIGHHSCEGACP